MVVSSLRPTPHPKEQKNFMKPELPVSGDAPVTHLPLGSDAIRVQCLL